MRDDTVGGCRKQIGCRTGIAGETTYVAADSGRNYLHDGERPRAARQSARFEDLDVAKAATVGLTRLVAHCSGFELRAPRFNSRDGEPQRVETYPVTLFGKVLLNASEPPAIGPGEQ